MVMQDCLKYNDLKQLLSLEAKYQPDMAIFDKLLEGSVRKKYDTYEPIIKSGEYHPDAYIVARGLVRSTYQNGNHLTTTGFGLPGTMFISYHCYYGDQPSFYSLEACCPTDIVIVSKEHVDELLRTSHDFSNWMLSVSMNQLFYNESKEKMLSGDAKTRLMQLIERISGNIPERAEEAGPSDNHASMVQRIPYVRWQEIFKIVPSKIIASYLGITEQHLSKIKREISNARYIMF